MTCRFLAASAMMHMSLYPALLVHAGFVPHYLGTSSGASATHLPIGSSSFRGDQYMLNGTGLQGSQQGAQVGFQRPTSAQSLGSRHSMQVSLNLKSPDAHTTVSLCAARTACRWT